jgi:hypothetical protein
MKYLLLVVTCLISACSTTVPVKQKFPSAPPQIQEKCPDLEKAPEDTSSILDLLIFVGRNYERHYECAAKVESWNDWYQQQKKIFDEVSK